MDAVAASLAAIALQHGVLASHLQMALTRQRVETEAQGLLTLLETARQARCESTTPGQSGRYLRLSRSAGALVA